MDFQELDVFLDLLYVSAILSEENSGALDCKLHSIGGIADRTGNMALLGNGIVI